MKKVFSLLLIGIGAVSMFSFIAPNHVDAAVREDVRQQAIYERGNLQAIKQPINPDAIRLDAVDRDAVDWDAIHRDAVDRDAVDWDAVDWDAIRLDAVDQDGIKAWHERGGNSDI